MEKPYKYAKRSPLEINYDHINKYNIVGTKCTMSAKWAELRLYSKIKFDDDTFLMR